MKKALELKEISKQEKWSKIIEEYQGSGQNIKEYCISMGVTTGAYYYNLKKARNVMAINPRLVSIDFVESELISPMVNISYYGANIQIRANDEITLCAVLSAVKKA